MYSEIHQATQALVYITEPADTITQDLYCDIWHHDIFYKNNNNKLIGGSWPGGELYNCSDFCTSVLLYCIIVVVVRQF